MLSASTSQESQIPGGSACPGSPDSPGGPEAQSLSTDDVDDLVGELQATLVDNTLANFAIGFLVTMIVLFLAVLVGGEFMGAIDAEGNPLGDVIDDMEGHVITAFAIFGVTLLVIPAVAAIVLIRGGFGMGNITGR